MPVMILTLTDKQVQAMKYLYDSETTELLFGGGAGGAKSFIGCYWILKMCQKYPGSRWVIGRSKLKNLEETTLNTFWEVAAILGYTAGMYHYNQQKGKITFPNGSQIILKDLHLYPSDKEFDSLGSLEITGAFVDECNQIVEKAWNVLKSRIRYKLDKFGLIPKILGTCNPAKNWVYHRFYKPHKTGALPTGRKFLRSLLDDNPHISKSYKDNLMSLDKPSVERLLHGTWEYDDDPAVLMSYDVIADIFTNDHIAPGDKYIVVDAARFGSDKAVISFWEGWRWMDVEIMDVSKTTDIKNKVIELKGKYMLGNSSVVIDADGIGGGVVDLLPGCKSFLNNGKPSDKYKEGNFDNIKSQCAFYLAEMVNSSEVYVSNKVAQYFSDGNSLQERISSELAVVKRDKIDDDGKLKIIKKEKMKELLGGRSPDCFDVMMMRSYFDLKPKYNLTGTAL